MSSSVPPQIQLPAASAGITRIAAAARAVAGLAVIGEGDAARRLRHLQKLRVLADIGERQRLDAVHRTGALRGDLATAWSTLARCE